jgi:hypothetical protein
LTTAGVTFSRMGAKDGITFGKTTAEAAEAGAVADGTTHVNPIPAINAGRTRGN